MVLCFAFQARMPFNLVIRQLLTIPADPPRQIAHGDAPEIHPVVCFRPDAKQLLFLVSNPNKWDLYFILVLFFRILGA